VVHPDVPIIVGIIVPAVGFFLGKNLVGDLVVRPVFLVVLLEPILDPVLPDALSRGMVEKKNSNLFRDGVGVGGGKRGDSEG
jgi:hypothetical protein